MPALGIGGSAGSVAVAGGAIPGGGSGDLIDQLGTAGSVARSGLSVPGPDWGPALKLMLVPDPGAG